MNHMSRGLKIIILAVVGIIVIGLIAYFIIIPALPGKGTAPKANVNAKVNSNLPLTNTQPTTNENVPPPPAEVPEITKQASSARTVALSFAGRFATYSNQNGLANLNDLEAISTPAVWNFIRGEYKKNLLKSLPPANTYYAMASTVLNAKITPISESEASATVAMQRVESGAVNKVSYETLNLKLKKIGENWLVSWEEWEK
jgi:hypothetical protein